MYHHTFSGNHYDIGFQWGSLLAARGNFILENIGFPIMDERIAFSERCLPLYQQYFPEILEEINGIADGQGCSSQKLCAFLFSMYAMPPACHCSCFAVSRKGCLLFGRNSDFLTELEETNRNVIYHFETNSYSFTGNTTAFVQMEDGINEKGLAVGMTSVFPRTTKPGFNAGLLLRYFLEKCSSTEHALEELQRLPISSAQTITFADVSGSIAVAECDAKQISITQASDAIPHVYATNCFHSDAMEVLLSPAADDWDSERRYQTLSHTLSHKMNDFSLQDAMDLLSGRHGFLCQYDRTTGRDTVWSVIYDLSNHRIYRAEGNPARYGYTEDSRFRF